MYRSFPALLSIVACADPPTGPTWHADVAPVIAARCGGCHQAGGIGPFALTSYDEVVAVAGPVELSITSGAMPPWQGGDDCNEYSNNSSLRPDEKELLLGWLADGTPEGDPDTAATLPEVPSFDADLVLPLPEPYTPTREPDDYRCQLVDWPLDETAWVTGLEVDPDQQAIVHHAIVFAVAADKAETYRGYDAAEAGPGYTCFGGPTPVVDDGVDTGDWTLADLQAAVASGEFDTGLGGARWLGAWVPGAQANPFPQGTGLRMEPGELLVVQMHYNTNSAAPVADQSSVAIQVADAVEREAVATPLTDAGWYTGLDILGGPMTIPAGADNVSHTYSARGDSFYFAGARATLGVESSEPLVIHSAAHHMHLLGKTGRQSVSHAAGSETCLADIPEWDFSWQGDFTLVEPVVMQADDTFVMTCTWDNSQANQPVVDGEQQETRDVAWGEGSTDEMCLSILYLTRQ